MPWVDESDLNPNEEPLGKKSIQLPTKKDYGSSLASGSRPQPSGSPWMLYTLLLVTALSLAGNLWLVFPMINFKGERHAWEIGAEDRKEQAVEQSERLKKLRTESSDLNNEIDSQTKKAGEIQSNIANLESTHEKYEHESSQLEKLRVEQNLLTAKKEALEEANEFFEEKTKEKEDLGLVSAQLKDAKLKLDQVNKDLEDARKRLAITQSLAAAGKATHESLISKIQADEAKEDQAKKALVTAQKALADKKAELQLVEQDKQDAEIKIKAYKARNEVLKMERDTFNSEIRTATAEVKTSTDALRIAKDKLADKKAELKQADEDVIDAEEKLLSIETRQAGLAKTVSGLLSDLRRLNAKVSEKRKEASPTPPPSPDDSSPNNDAKAPQ